MNSVLVGTTLGECVARRRRFMDELSSGLVVFPGAPDRPQGWLSCYFRQNSTFLYLTGLPVPGATLVIDVDNETVHLFVPEQEKDALVMDDPLPSPEKLRAASGIDEVHAPEELEAFLEMRAGDRTPLVFHEEDLEGDKNDPALVEAVVKTRLQKSAGEIARIRAAMKITNRAHSMGMAVVCPGAVERQVLAMVHAVMGAANCQPSFSSIATGRGQIVHVRSSDGILRADQLLLLDVGVVAEGGNGAVTDITRTFPVSGKFSDLAGRLYDVVLEAVDAGIEQCRPDVMFEEVHRAASMALIGGLIKLKLLMGDPDAIYAANAQAVFFPHGIGHFVGHDIFPCHDLQTLGEAACYRDGQVRRSDLLGRNILRINQRLQPDQVVTIEPGFYVSEALIMDAALREQFAQFVNFELAETMLGFGGIRIEDMVLVTTGDPENLSAGIPRTRKEIEGIVGTMSWMLASFAA